MKRGIGLLLLVVSLSAIAAGKLPMSIFVVHCEPTNANEVLWGELVSLVTLADQHRVPLTIDFTAQWAEMILADDAKVAALEDWLASGHEIACHHHAYWSVLERAASWDGYTNTPVDEILPQYRAQYRGTMEDYMALLNALPGERRSGCLGGSDERDHADWPCQLIYSTVGNALDDAVSTPGEKAYAECDVLEIGHALIIGPPRGALQEAFESTDADSIFGVVGHVYNYADFAAPFELWFAFLGSIDPAGARRSTVSGLLDSVMEPAD